MWLAMLDSDERRLLDPMNQYCLSARTWRSIAAVREFGDFNTSLSHRGRRLTKRGDWADPPF
jgi:hypothetical protein